MKHVFLMDPLEHLFYEKDTSVALIHALFARNESVFHLSPEGISYGGRGLIFRVRELFPDSNRDRRFQVSDMQTLEADGFDFFWIRTDPPFDESYLRVTWLLEHAPKSLTILNTPLGIRTVNEKLWALQFQKWIPHTVVTHVLEDCLLCLERFKTVILKPVDLFGGQGVFKLTEGDSNIPVIFETLSDGGRKPLICQEYVPEAVSGDKRILLVNGQPLGAVRRCNAGGDHRHNVFAGGQCLPADISDLERDCIEELRPQLMSLGLFFVGLDFIGNHLIEVNVTSPTCLVEMSALMQADLSRVVIDEAYRYREQFLK